MNPTILGDIDVDGQQYLIEFHPKIRTVIVIGPYLVDGYAQSGTFLEAHTQDGAAIAAINFLSNKYPRIPRDDFESRIRLPTD